MKTLTTSELSDNIKRSLGINPRNRNYLLESYVAQEKMFNLPTEFLSESSKSSHINFLICLRENRNIHMNPLVAKIRIKKLKNYKKL